MELKEIKYLPNSVETNVVTPPERNFSQDQERYTISFPLPDEEPDKNTDNEHSGNIHQKTTFGNVSTLDWLKTWRSTEISYVSSSDPGK